MTEPFVPPVLDMTPFDRVRSLYDAEHSMVNADPKMVMVRNAQRLGFKEISKLKTEDIHFDDVCIQLAGDLYQYFFSNMIQHYLLNDELGEAPQEVAASCDAFDFYRPASVESAVYAKTILPRMSGVEQRILTLGSLDNVEFLFGTASYLGLLKDPGLIHRLTSQALNPNIPAGDVFISSMLYFHLNFLNYSGGLRCQEE